MNIAKDDLDARTAYEILGLSSAATLTEIRSAYLTLVRVYHPDKNVASVSASTAADASSPVPAAGGAGGTPRIEIDDALDGSSVEKKPGADLIVRLNEAYATLSSPESRAAYDARLLADRSSSHPRDANGLVGGGGGEEGAPRISATVELDDFEVKHMDEVDVLNSAEARAQLADKAGAAKRHAMGLGVDEQYLRDHQLAEDSDDDDDDDDAGGGANIVFVYPCRCGHAFVVHPDELLTTAMTSDATDGIGIGVAGLNLEERPQQQATNLGPPPANGMTRSRRGSTASSIRPFTDASAAEAGATATATTTAGAMSVLSTCSGCSQVIRVVWGHADDDDDDDDDLSDDDDSALPHAQNGAVQS
ncbi:hypothetical protein OC834_005529 [Tilletia horrida]|nr:hypothetical protein OC834_005529 [Tilletia horrida]KAK0534173.1 hypothetical protein OC835_002775 [Tilletia horrida]